MGRHLYESQPIFRQTLDHCDEILRPLLGESILSILYPEAEGDNAQSKIQNLKFKIDNTRYAQPAIFALEYALASLWQAWGIQPAVVMGHSVGELVAACVAGVFSLADGLKLIAARARLMSELPETGEMITVLADEARVQSLLAQLNGAGEGVAIAALNGPQQVVLSGRTAALQSVTTILAGEGIQSRKLSVSHAFHSPLMEPMVAAFAQVANTIAYHPPQIPMVSNLTGNVAGHEIATADYWVRHVRQPVRFADGIATLNAEQTTIFLEIGPKPTLLSLARQCLDKETRRQGDKETAVSKQSPPHLVTPSPHLPVFLPTLRQGRDDWQQVCESLGELYVRGVQISWAAVDQGLATRPAPRRVKLPPYPFQRQRYWIEPSFKAQPPVAADPQSLLRALVNHNNLDQLTHLLIETGLLPKVLERLMTAYHPAVGGEQQRGQTRLSPLVEQPVAALNQPQPAPQPSTQPLAQQLAKLDGNTQRAHLTAWFQRTAAQMLGYAESQLMPQSIAGSLGMDSLMVIELRNRVEQEMGVTLPVATLLTASFEQLATIAIEQLATESSQSSTVAAAAETAPLPLMATLVSAPQPWVRCLQPNPQARLRLFCLPYAGSGAAIYRTWANALPATIELCAIQLPGREDRLHEPAYRQWSALIAALVEGIHPYLDKPFAIFGHSMGALLGYEVACALHQQHNVQPSHLLVSAHRAPQIVGQSTYRSRWELLEDLYRQAGVDDALRQESDLMTMSKEVFSADLDLSKSYRYRPSPPLTCPLTVLGGSEDAICSPEALEAWRDHTTGPFTLHWLPGNHFFIHHARARLLSLLAETVQAY
jgi:acyl transferase domain-containing protein